MISRATQATSALIAAAVLVLSNWVNAAEASFTVDHDNPRASVPPEAERIARPAAYASWLSEVRSHAEAAERRGDWTKAVKYHQAVSFAEPNGADAFAELCDIHELHLSDPQQAEHYCWAAVKREDATLADRYHFLDLAFALQAAEQRAGVKLKRGQMIHALLEDLRAEAREQPTAIPSQAGTRNQGYLPLAQQRELYACRLAATMEVQAALESCLKDASAVGVSKRALLPFEWKLHHDKGDVEGAAAVERAATAAGLHAEDLAKLAVGAAQDVGLLLKGAPLAASTAPTGTSTVEASPLARAEANATRGAAGAPLEVALAIGAGALGVALLTWLAIDRGKRFKAAEAQGSVQVPK